MRSTSTSMQVIDPQHRTYTRGVVKLELNKCSRGYSELKQTNGSPMDEYLKDRDAGYPTFISPFATVCNARINLWNEWT